MKRPKRTLSADQHQHRSGRGVAVALALAVLTGILGWASANVYAGRADTAAQGEAQARTETADTRTATSSILDEVLAACATTTSHRARALCNRAAATQQAIQAGDPLPGPTGAPGAPGKPGATGATGGTGANGARGATGSNGATGARGAVGPAGQDGTDGTNGAQGATGPAGPPGPQGPQGDTGPQGPSGPAGTDGQDGQDGADGQPCPTGYTLTATTIVTAEGPVDAYVCQADNGTPAPSPTEAPTAGGRAR